MLKAVIFDFDGVIQDTFELAYAINVKVQTEPISREEYRDFFNGNIFAHKRIDADNAQRFFEIQNEEFKKLRIDEDIRNELLKMKNQYDLFIVSSNMELALNEYIKNNNMHGIFTEVLGKESHQSKVEKFKTLIQKYNLNKENCIFVTDTLGDLLEAQKVDLPAIAVDFGFHERSRLEKGNPFKIVSEFCDILPTIEDYYLVPKI